MPGVVFRNIGVTAIQKPFHHKVKSGGPRIKSSSVPAGTHGTIFLPG